MDLVIVGPGRAGGSIALAARSAGHAVVGVLARTPGGLEPVVQWDRPLPACDLVVVSVNDSAISEVAERIAPHIDGAGAVVHLSGYTSVSALRPVGDRGKPIGSFHPLQTLPDPERGAEALRGAWAAVTAPPGLTESLESLAESLGMHSFRLADDAKPAYHAGASAAANYVVESLALAADLLQAAGVPLEAVESLTRRVVDNVFQLGPADSLTGPIARGDTETVAGQQDAADRVSESVGRQFRLLAQATADRVNLR